MIVTISSKSAANIQAQASEHGIFIMHGWTVPISKKEIIHYINTYNVSPNAGFFEIGNMISLTHNHAKITFTPEEYQSVKNLVEAAYTGVNPLFP